MNKRIFLGVVVVLVEACLGMFSAQAAGETATVPAALPPQIGSPAHNERWAVNDLRTIVGAQTALHAATNRYAAVFSELITPAQGSPYLLGAWEGPRRGYVFRLSSADNGQSAFTVTAEPWKPGVTGQRCFFIDQSGVVRGENGKTAGPESPPLATESGKAPVPDATAPAYQAPSGISGTVLRWLGYKPPGSFAVGCARTMLGAEVAYHSVFGRYAQAIDEMLAPATNPPFLFKDDKNYAWPMAGGCRFTLLPVPDPAASFVLLVEPVDRDTSGNRWLYTDQSGVIRWSATPDIGPDSPPL